MDQSITFNLSSIEASIAQIRSNISDMEEIQESINNYLSSFRETWATSKSASVFEKLEAFVAKNGSSSLTMMLNELHVTLEKLEQVFKHVETIDNIGA